VVISLTLPRKEVKVIPGKEPTGVDTINCQVDSGAVSAWLIDRLLRALVDRSTLRAATMCTW